MAESYWDYIKTAYDEVSVYDGAEVFSDGLNRFPSDVGDLLAAHWFLSEMSNGGISQFFANPTEIAAERAVLGFANLGLPVVADALKKSIARAEDSSETFEEEERVIYLVGGSDLGRIYDRMDAYAKMKKANQAVDPTREARGSL